MPTTSFQTTAAVLSPLPHHATTMRLVGRCFLALLSSAALLSAASSSAQATPPTKTNASPIHSVVLLSDAGDSAQAKHGLSALEKSLRARGLTDSQTSAFLWLPSGI